MLQVFIKTKKIVTVGHKKYVYLQTFHECFHKLNVCKLSLFSV